MGRPLTTGVGVASCAVAFVGGTVADTLSLVGTACAVVLWGAVVRSLVAGRGGTAERAPSAAG